MYILESSTSLLIDEGKVNACLQDCRNWCVNISATFACVSDSAVSIVFMMVKRRYVGIYKILMV